MSCFIQVYRNPYLFSTIVFVISKTIVFYRIGNSAGILFYKKHTSCENAQLAAMKLVIQTPLARGESRLRDSFLFYPIDISFVIVYYLTISLVQKEVHMNYNAEIPIYLQVIQDIKKKMVQGKIQPGEKLPSNRELAVLYKINQNTAARIYKEMEIAGYCYTKRGIGTFVVEDGKMFEQIKEEMAEELLRTFMNGMRDLGYHKDDIIFQIADYKEEEVK